MSDPARTSSSCDTGVQNVTPGSSRDPPTAFAITYSGTIISFHTRRHTTCSVDTSSHSLLPFQLYLSLLLPSNIGSLCYSANTANLANIPGIPRNVLVDSIFESLPCEL